MKNTFDPLILVTKGNQEIKDAYYAGVEFGREKEREVFDVRLTDLFLWIEKRTQQIEKSVLPQRNNQSGIKPVERKWYIAGYKDVKKMARKSLSV